MIRRITFSQQAKVFVQYAVQRTRRPMKPATIQGFESYLRKWLLPALGDSLLVEINNGKLRTLVAHMHKSGLSPKSIDSYIGLVKLVVASAVDEEGEELFPRKWNADFIGMPVVRPVSLPAVSGEIVTKLIERADGQIRVLYALLAGSGLRVGEAFGLELKHLSEDFTTLFIRQSVWHSTVQSPKTENAIRDVDISTEVAALLKELVGTRRSGFVFQTRLGTPLHQSNIIRRHLHPHLADLGVAKFGFHTFRRFRVTHLRKNNAPEDLLRGWLGHSAASLTDRYCKLFEDVAYRKQVIERVGNGFELPSSQLAVCA
jgi:integrase